MIDARAALCAVLIAATSCGTSMVVPPCRLGVEHDVGRVNGTSIEEVAIVSTRGGSIVAWSSTEGTFARVLAADARPRGEARAIAPFARGGIAMAVTSRGRGAAETEVVALLAVEPGDEAGRFGAVRLWELDAHGAPRGEPIVLGGTGLYSDGAALAAGRDGGWIAAWHDGAPGAFRVRIAEVSASGAVEPRGGRIVTTEGRTAWAPSLATSPRGWSAAWQETWFDDRNRESGALRVLVPPGRARDVRPIARPEAGPSLVWFGDRWVLSYRDNEDRDRHAEYYVGPLHARPRPAGTARTGDATERNPHGDARVSRANGPRPPRLVACGPVLLGVAVRSFARNMLVGINRIGDGLEKRGGELQVYEELQGLSRTSVACRSFDAEASELVIAYAEQGIATRPERHVRAASMRCAR